MIGEYVSYYSTIVLYVKPTRSVIRTARFYIAFNYLNLQYSK